MSLLSNPGHRDPLHLPLPHQGDHRAVPQARDGRQSCLNAQLQPTAAMRTQVYGPQGRGVFMIFRGGGQWVISLRYGVSPWISYLSPLEFLALGIGPRLEQRGDTVCSLCVSVCVALIQFFDVTTCVFVHYVCTNSIPFSPYVHVRCVPHCR